MHINGFRVRNIRNQATLPGIIIYHRQLHWQLFEIEYRLELAAGAAWGRSRPAWRGLGYDQRRGRGCAGAAVASVRRRFTAHTGRGAGRPAPPCPTPRRSRAQSLRRRRRSGWRSSPREIHTISGGLYPVEWRQPARRVALAMGLLLSVSNKQDVSRRTPLCWPVRGRGRMRRAVPRRSYPRRAHTPRSASDTQQVRY